MSQEASDAARKLQSMRKKHGAGTGRPRKILHSTEGYCTCVECRKKRGHYYKNSIDNNSAV